MWNGYDLEEQAKTLRDERLRQAEHARLLREVRCYNRHAVELGLGLATPLQRCFWWLARSAGAFLVTWGRRVEGLDRAAARRRLEMDGDYRTLRGYRSEIVW